MHIPKKRVVIVALIVYLFLLLSFTALAAQPNTALDPKYSRTTNAVFFRLMRLQGQETVEDPAENDEIPEQAEPTETESESHHDQAERVGEGGQKQATSKPKEEGSTLIQGIPDFGEKSIMERLQEDSKISPEQLTNKIDSFATNIYNTVTEAFAGITPLILLGGALLLFFSRGKTAGLVVALIAAMVIIFNAPEITKMFINVATGILR